MKILFISTKSPMPTIDGASLRTFNLLKQVSIHNELYLLSFVKSPIEYKYRAKLLEICKCVELIDVAENNSVLNLALSLTLNLFSNRSFVAAKYDKIEMRLMIKQILTQEQIDLIHLDSLPLASYLDILENRHVVLNEHNVESSLIARRVAFERNHLVKLFYSIQQRRLEKFEKQAVKNIGSCIACSVNDKALLEEMSPGCSVTVVPNGVDIDYFKLDRRISIDVTKIVFVGGMNWFPNKDAVEWFDKEVLPYLLNSSSNIKVHIIGKSTLPLPLKNPQYFIFHGFVDDIRPYVADASVFIAPLRVGGGTRLKLLDAMAMGKAIVSTTIGAEGLEVKNGEQMILADTPQAFADAVVALLNDPAKRITLGNYARAFVEQKYSWNHIGKILLGVYDRTVASHMTEKEN